MSEFVNYKKRGIELPPGCKDLIDVLPPSKDTQIPAEGLAHIQRYLSRLLQSSSERRSVWINSYKFPVAIGLVYGKGKLGALIFLTAEREQPMRAALSKAGIFPTQDDAIDGDGPFARFFLCWLPVDALDSGRLVLELIRSGYGLSEDVLLEFHYSEKQSPDI